VNHAVFTACNFCILFCIESNSWDIFLSQQQSGMDRK